METTTTQTVQPCPDPTLYAVSVWKQDRRTKTGERLVEEYTMQFASELEALQHAQEVEGFRLQSRVVYRPYWVRKEGYMAPHNVFWEPWNTPNYCSPASESYYSM